MKHWTDVFQQNLARLRERDPELAQQLAGPWAEADSDGIELLPSRSGHLTARVRRDGRALFVHSSVDPVAEAERWAAVQEVPPDGRLVLLGLGLGYPAVSLYRRLRGGRLIILEPSPTMARAALHNPALTELLTQPGVTLLVGPWRPALTGKLWNALHTLRAEGIRVLEFPPRSRLEPGTFSELAQHVLALVRSVVVNNNTLRFFAERWTQNLLANLPLALAHPPASLLFGAFRGVPAIIVAAGPSLNRNIGLLAAAKGRALILAVGTALRPLLRAGIEPDLVITIDGSEANYRHFRDVAIAGVPLLYDVICYPDIPRHWQGPGLTLASALWFSSWVGQYVDEPFAPYTAGPSVSNAALDVAARMGCDPVIFVGLDLGYTGGQSHAAGSTYIRSLEEVGREARLVQARGWDGEPVWTDSSFLYMAQWFEAWLTSARGTPLVIDATEGGVRKEGMQPMRLQEALARYATHPVDIASRLNEILATWPGRRPEQVAALCQALTSARQDLQRMAAQARVGQKLSRDLEEAVRQGNSGRVQNLLQRLDRVDRALRAAARLGGLLSLALHPVTEALKRMEAEAGGQDREVLVSRKSQLLYEGIASTAESLVRWLAESEAELRERFALAAHHLTGGVT